MVECVVRSCDMAPFTLVLSCTLFNSAEFCCCGRLFSFPEKKTDLLGRNHSALLPYPSP